LPVTRPGTPPAGTRAAARWPKPAANAQSRRPSWRQRRRSWRESGETLRADCARRIVSLLSDADSLQSQPVVRVRAGDRLAQLGDPASTQRFYLPTDEMLGFVRIAADPGS
jgi:hypothetical protein